ncbi:MAG: IS30 family transposase [Candidatus Paceibacterota bacterium]|jgi:IS30 family transposase
MAHHHFSIEERFKIQAWIELNLSKAEMARRLDKDYSTVFREIKNNSYENGVYKALHANALARRRRKEGKRKSKKLLCDNDLKEALIKGMKKKKSPEQIMGERRITGKSFVSTETVYSFIYSEEKYLILFLRQKKGKYRRRHGTKNRSIARELMKKRRIDDRPEEINERKEMGHWEGDTVVGKDKQNGVATYVERVSGYGRGIKLEKVRAEELKEKTVKSFSSIPKKKRKSVTYDNGSEFAEYEMIEKETGMDVYFANPYHSWERGSNENWNGLLRQYFPKRTDFDMISQKEIDKAVRELNNRPRKRLNYLTPYQVFVKEMNPKDYCISS